MEAGDGTLRRSGTAVQQIKEKSKERKSLVAEKKELPVYRVMRHKALAVRITELTEDLEELRSEKSLLLQKPECRRLFLQHCTPFD